MQARIKSLRSNDITTSEQDKIRASTAAEIKELQENDLVERHKFAQAQIQSLIDSLREILDSNATKSEDKIVQNIRYAQLAEDLHELTAQKNTADTLMKSTLDTKNLNPKQSINLLNDINTYDRRLNDEIPKKLEKIKNDIGKYKKIVNTIKQVENVPLNKEPLNKEPPPVVEELSDITNILQNIEELKKEIDDLFEKYPKRTQNLIELQKKYQKYRSINPATDVMNLQRIRKELLVDVQNYKDEMQKFNQKISAAKAKHQSTVGAINAINAEINEIIQKILKTKSDFQKSQVYEDYVKINSLWQEHNDRFNNFSVDLPQEQLLNELVSNDRTILSKYNELREAVQEILTRLSLEISKKSRPAPSKQKPSQENVRQADVKVLPPTEPNLQELWADIGLDEQEVRVKRDGQQSLPQALSAPSTELPPRPSAPLPKAPAAKSSRVSLQEFIKKYGFDTEVNTTISAKNQEKIMDWLSDIDSDNDSDIDSNLRNYGSYVKNAAYYRDLQIKTPAQLSSRIQKLQKTLGANEPAAEIPSNAWDATELLKRLLKPPRQEKSRRPTPVAPAIITAAKELAPDETAGLDFADDQNDFIMGIVRDARGAIIDDLDKILTIENPNEILNIIKNIRQKIDKIAKIDQNTSENLSLQYTDSLKKFIEMFTKDISESLQAPTQNMQRGIQANLDILHKIIGDSNLTRGLNSSELKEFKENHSILSDKYKEIFEPARIVQTAAVSREMDKLTKKMPTAETSKSLAELNKQREIIREHLAAISAAYKEDAEKYNDLREVIASITDQLQNPNFSTDQVEKLFNEIPKIKIQHTIALMKSNQDQVPNLKKSIKTELKSVQTSDPQQYKVYNEEIDRLLRLPLTVNTDQQYTAQEKSLMPQTIRAQQEPADINIRALSQSTETKNILSRVDERDFMQNKLAATIKLYKEDIENYSDIRGIISEITAQLQNPNFSYSYVQELFNEIPKIKISHTIDLMRSNLDQIPNLKKSIEYDLNYIQELDQSQYAKYNKEIERLSQLPSIPTRQKLAPIQRPIQRPIQQALTLPLPIDISKQADIQKRLSLTTQPEESAVKQADIRQLMPPVNPQQTQEDQIAKYTQREQNIRQLIEEQQRQLQEIKEFPKTKQRQNFIKQTKLFIEKMQNITAQIEQSRQQLLRQEKQYFSEQQRQQDEYQQNVEDQQIQILRNQLNAGAEQQRQQAAEQQRQQAAEQQRQQAAEQQRQQAAEQQRQQAAEQQRQQDEQRQMQRQINQQLDQQNANQLNWLNQQNANQLNQFSQQNANQLNWLNQQNANQLKQNQKNIEQINQLRQNAAQFKQPAEQQRQQDEQRERQQQIQEQSIRKEINQQLDKLIVKQTQQNETYKQREQQMKQVIEEQREFTRQSQQFPETQQRLQFIARTLGIAKQTQRRRELEEKARQKEIEELQSAISQQNKLEQLKRLKQNVSELEKQWQNKDNEEIRQQDVENQNIARLQMQLPQGALQPVQKEQRGQLAAKQVELQPAAQIRRQEQAEEDIEEIQKQLNVQMAQIRRQEELQKQLAALQPSYKFIMKKQANLKQKMKDLRPEQTQKLQSLDREIQEWNQYLQQDLSSWARSLQEHERQLQRPQLKQAELQYIQDWNQAVAKDIEKYQERLDGLTRIQNVILSEYGSEQKSKAQRTSELSIDRPNIQISREEPDSGFDDDDDDDLSPLVIKLGRILNSNYTLKQLAKIKYTILSNLIKNPINSSAQKLILGADINDEKGLEIKFTNWLDALGIPAGPSSLARFYKLLMTTLPSSIWHQIITANDLDK